MTDRATLSLSSGSICLGSSWCTRYGGGAGAELALGLPSADPADFAVTLGATLDLGGAAYRGGFLARVRGGPLALLVTPQVRYFPGTNNRDVWRYVLAGQLQLPLKTESKELILCTPALSGAHIFLRSDSALWRLGGAE